MAAGFLATLPDDRLGKPLLTTSMRIRWTALALSLAITAPPMALAEPSFSPAWTRPLPDPPGRKLLIGSDAGDRSRVVFTGSEGQLDEIFFPRPDQVLNLVQQWQVTAADGEWSELESEGRQRLQRPDRRALVWSSLGESPHRRWRISRRVFVDPHRDVLVQRLTLEPGLAGAEPLWILRNRSLLPQVQVSERAGRPVLLRRDPSGTTMALMLSQPWRLLPATGLADTDSLELQRRPGATGPVDLTVVMGFGYSESQAIEQALASLKADPMALEHAAVTAWRRYAGGLEPAVQQDHQSLLAALVLHASQDRSSGGIVAGLATPWGTTNRSLNPYGYHLVWSRDLVHSAEALLAAGDRRGANQATTFLFRTLMQRQATSEPFSVPGRFPQNAFLNGKPHWNATQLDETALPLVLAWRLNRLDLWPDLRQAADYVAAAGPMTQQERWEEMGGYSPSTLAAAIAGLVCAADLARRLGDDAAAARWLAVADRWRNHLTAWTFTTKGPHGNGRYFVRIDGNGRPDDAEQLLFGNGAGMQDVRRIVDGGFLELVRLGVLHPSDWAITASLPVLDQVIGRTISAQGPYWFRYNFDGYGENNDGSAYRPSEGSGSGHGAGRGRLWPILTAERGLFEILRHRRGSAGRAHLRSLRAAASPEGLIPEQIWNTSTSVDGWSTLTPAREPVGASNGSIQPLNWAMGASIQLALAVQRGGHAVPAVVCQRYGCADRPAIVDVETRALLQPDERLLVVGNDPRLGDGHPENGVPLRPLGGQRWGTSITLSQGRRYRLQLVAQHNGEKLSRSSEPTEISLPPAPAGVLRHRTVRLTLADSPAFTRDERPSKKAESP